MLLNTGNQFRDRKDTSKKTGKNTRSHEEEDSFTIKYPSLNSDTNSSFQVFMACD
jgi:hypothetical protein